MCVLLKVQFKVYMVPRNTWVGAILAKGRSDELTTLFAKDDRVTTAC